MENAHFAQKGQKMWKMRKNAQKMRSTFPPVLVQSVASWKSYGMLLFIGLGWNFTFKSAISIKHFIHLNVPILAYIVKDE